ADSPKTCPNGSGSLRGTLMTGVGIRDYTIPFRINYARSRLLCETVFTGLFDITFDGYQGTVEPQVIFDPQCVLRRCTLIEEMELQYVEQAKYEYAKVIIEGGELFPQGQTLTLNIGGGKFTGVFSGNEFTISSREHPQFEEIGPSEGL